METAPPLLGPLNGVSDEPVGMVGVHQEDTAWTQMLRDASRDEHGWPTVGSVDSISSSHCDKIHCRKGHERTGCSQTYQRSCNRLLCIRLDTCTRCLHLNKHSKHGCLTLSHACLHQQNEYYRISLVFKQSNSQRLQLSMCCNSNKTVN